jgi:hypothetical protein
MLNQVYKFITSLKLTVVLLALGLVLVFWGTLGQVDLGLYRAQSVFFRSFFIYEKFPGLNFRIPFPGGYAIGWLLLINLFAAHFRYYQPGQKKYGIVMVHLGVVLLLLGQLLTDVLSTESLLHLRNGETKNYSEASSHYELAVIDTTEPTTDKVVAIPAHRLAQGGEIHHPALPFTVRVNTFHPNSSLTEKPAAGYTEITTTAGFGAGIWWRGLPHETSMDKRDMPSGIIELLTPQGSLGTFLISIYLTRPQEFTANGRRYQLTLRGQRFYKPFTLHLIEFKHDKYPGTDIPKNFSSRVRLQRAETREDREVLIYMNNPLRYAGDTYYQASFDPDNQGTVLQVVHNPSWLTPYFACVIVGLGMIVQFLTHLAGFAAKRKAA